MVRWKGLVYEKKVRWKGHGVRDEQMDGPGKDIVYVKYDQRCAVLCLPSFFFPPASAFEPPPGT